MTESVDIDDTVNASRSGDGFGLQHFEVLNWGTFDQHVWQMSPNDANSLLTGNIGSGKSTLVDGLTTLLVPTRKLAFNKAAGAEEKERSLFSYFHGYYTSNQDELGKARAVGLRPGNKHISVLLARFHCQALNETVTLAQVLWQKPNERKVQRLFVVARSALSIGEHFSGFGSQLLQLKQRLRKQAGVELFDTFPPYAQAFSKYLGLGSDGKALELFNQTISMKSVGSVTDFVRQNMLQRPDLEQKLQDLERNYDDLKRLHDAVVAAREKIQLLEPVDRFGREALQAAEDKHHVELCRDVTEHYVAHLATDLYNTRIANREQALARLNIQSQAQQAEISDIGQRISQLQNQIQLNGGSRLQELDSEIARLSKAREDSQRLCRQYQKLAGELGLGTELNDEQFVANIAAASSLYEQSHSDQQQLDDNHFKQKHQLELLKNQQQKLTTELSALKQRKSNINYQQLQIRQLLCEQLDIDETRLPFVGELLQVKAEAAHWQGAIERVLHNFALSLMVPEELYGEICELIEQTHLGSRLVYYRVQQPQQLSTLAPGQDSLLSKLAIKPDCDHYEWLRLQLERFDYQCCDQLSDFRRSHKAITANGQIKSGKFRHEKDDRHQLQDKSRYVLGWSNSEKIQLLEQQGKKLLDEQTALATQLDSLDGQRRELRERIQCASILANYDLQFHQINWPQISEQIGRCQQEKQQLEQSSDVLQQLQQDLMAQQKLLAPAETRLRELDRETGSLESKLDAERAAQQQKKELLAELSDKQRNALFPTLEQFYLNYADTTLQLEGQDKLITLLRKKLNERIQHLEEKSKKKQAQMVNAMGRFAHAFPNESEELDCTLESLPEFQQLLGQLREEDLPRHEQRFKQMLNRDTIRAMALFRSTLDKQEEAITARITLINEALRELDYQDGTYIQIDSVNSQDIDVREFQQRLKQCIEHTADEQIYSEARFEEVKTLIEQMRNEPKWTQKVVDVRYWHLFNVIERYREDDSEKECYSDSGGKSGGQKEKLAYSILAAAILLQYGLVQDNSNASKRRFNLVVIDEAFARGSKDSTRFGLELFKQLGLQLLLVTPLQKLDVIEHYVSHVHFVDQRNNRSKLLNMTIEEYREQQQQHQHKQRYLAMVTDETTASMAGNS